MSVFTDRIEVQILNNQLAIMDSLKVLLTMSVDPRVEEPAAVTLNKAWLSSSIKNTTELLGESTYHPLKGVDRA